MSKNLLNNFKILIIVIMFVLSFTVSVLIFYDISRPNYYSLYFLMPLSFIILLLCLLPYYKELLKSVSCTMITGMYFLKFVLIPFFTFLGNYSTFMQNENAYFFINQATILLVYEMICVSFCFLFFHAKHKTICNNSSLGIGRKQSTSYDGFDMVIFISAAIIILILLIYPTLRSNFHFATQIKVALDPVIATRSWRTFGSESKLPYGIINTLLLKLFPTIQLMFPIIVIEKIQIKLGDRNENKGFLYSIIVMILTLMIMTEANGTTILVCFTLFVLILSIYPSIGKRFAIILLPCFTIAVSILFMQKVQGSSDFGKISTVFNRLSKTLNAYFNGPANLSVTFLVKENYNHWIPIIETLGQLPIAGRLFDSYISSKMFNEVFWNMVGRTDQLLPSVGQGMLYFGWMLAPVIPVLFVSCSMLLEKKAIKSKNIKLKGLLYFGSVLTAFMIGNNLSHFLSFFFSYLPVIILLPISRLKIKWRIRAK